MLNSFLSMLHAHDILAPVSAANTAAATSAWKDMRGHEGLVGVLLYTGTVGAGMSITYTFKTATGEAGENSHDIAPLNGVPAVVAPTNDPHVELMVFDAAQIEGYLQVVGTITGAGPIIVAYAGLAMDKYA